MVPHRLKRGKAWLKALGSCSVPLFPHCYSPIGLNAGAAGAATTAGAVVRVAERSCDPSDKRMPESSAGWCSWGLHGGPELLPL